MQSQLQITARKSTNNDWRTWQDQLWAQNDANVDYTIPMYQDWSDTCF